MSVSQSDSGWYLWIAEFKVSAKREINIFTIISPRHISSRILWHFATRPPPFPWYILLYYNQSCREASAAVPLMPRWIFATGPSLGCSRFFGRRPDFFFKRTSFFSFERHRASPKVAPTHSCSLLYTVLVNVPTINCSDQGAPGQKDAQGIIPISFFNVDFWCPWTNIQPCVQKFATQVFFFENISPVSITKVSFKRFKLIENRSLPIFLQSLFALLVTEPVRWFYWDRRRVYFWKEILFVLSCSSLHFAVTKVGWTNTLMNVNVDITPKLSNLDVIIFKTAKYNLHKTFDNHL